MNMLPQVDAVTAAIGKLCDALPPIQAIESLPLSQCAGRILSEPLAADRDSPPLDVSAMDGYALRQCDLSNRSIEVAGIAAAGQPTMRLAAGQTIRIFTGAPIPSGAELVVKREDTIENDDTIELCGTAEQFAAGLHIRRGGENIAAGQVVLPAGALLTSMRMAALATFATGELFLQRKLKVVVLNTGDELVQPGEPVQDWQIRDSNGPLLESWLRSLPWIEFVGRHQVTDSLASVQQALKSHQSDCDAIIFTGGVSMGDADFVPEAIESIGGEILFHRLPIRPGKPVLGARIRQQLVIGLPGNPVSVAVTSRVIALPLLQHLAGMRSDASGALVELSNADDKSLHLIWYRLVEISPHGQVSLVDGRGSGDLVALARSRGVVEIPPGQSGAGPWRLHPW